MSPRLRTSAAVAALALALTACGGDDASTDTTDTGDTTTDAAAPAELAIKGTDTLAFDPTELSAGAGEVTITLTADPTVNHDVTIEELDNLLVVAAPAGGTASGTVTLDAGTYTYYCNVPGHRAAGMEGTITVA